MINSCFTLALIISCITTLTRVQCADTFNTIKAAGVCSAFGIILPSAVGVGCHFFEEHIGLKGPSKWREEEHLKIEASKLLQTTLMTAVGILTWTIVRGFVPNDIRASLVMMSLYAYGQGRALFRDKESKLLKATSYCLPTALGILLYTRVPEIAPYIDIAGKSILVLGLAHICGA